MVRTAVLFGGKNSVKHKCCLAVGVPVKERSDSALRTRSSAAHSLIFICGMPFNIYFVFIFSKISALQLNPQIKTFFCFSLLHCRLTESCRKE